MKKILGLDLGTNSIGWAVVNADDNAALNISSCGSRIIPMAADILGDFEKGNSVSQTAVRTKARMARRMRERNLLRRERLLRVLNILGFLPEHFALTLDRYGKFVDDSEPKIAWKMKEDGKKEFLFKDSFNEMLADFAKYNPDLVASDKKVPYDWTIYYLRKKALTQKITKEELAWILLQFNQKRGYYQLRGEDEEEDKSKLVEYLAQKVVKVEPTDDKKDDGIWYNVFLENGMIYRRSSKMPLDWVGKVKEFIVTTDLEKDGSPKKDKDGNIKRSFRAPKEDDWTLKKKKSEYDILQSGKTVGWYIYDALLAKPDLKIIGKLVRTVERKFYKDELKLIIENQKQFIPELRDEQLYLRCLEALYPSNEAYRQNIAKRDFVYLLKDDILFYQRPLKSKNSLISNCSYEFYIDNKDLKHFLKCAAKSNPYFQEFRVWQYVQNIKVYPIDDLQKKPSMPSLFEQPIDIEKLFEFLNDRDSVEQNDVLKFYKLNPKEYRWNYPDDKKIPCNETRATILKGLKNAGVDKVFLTKENEYALWHILYSISDKVELEKALKTFADKKKLNSQSFVESFAKIKPFEKDYASYSEKAIKKLLPLMRFGKYWSKENIDSDTRERIDKIVNGEFDENISNQVREKNIGLKQVTDYQFLPVWLACYVVYNRHSEVKDITKWKTPDDIDDYLSKFKQHSLHNPIVEQVITETLRTVRDIWKQEGSIDEIHLELGREMKNPADKRKKMSEHIQQNENTNLRIKAMLAEFINPEHNMENVRPYSPSQQDLLRIYEENALDNLTKDDKDYDFISKISKQAQPTKSDIIRYKCWLEQKYRSPYTGAQITLSRLFTSDYEIEHVIPQSRYFDDSFSNKVICESAVNKLKDRQLGLEFIKEHHGEIVPLGNGSVVRIFEVDDYQEFVKDHYATNRIKMKKLLMDDIPDEFIERQLNDSRYISKLVKGLLSNIVREAGDNGEYEPEAVSKNLISCNGSITDRLKKDWGVNDVWNRIVLPRFERLNELTGKDCFTTKSAEGHLIPSMPMELQKGFNKKRIDHRHHAMDAIVIACTTRDHVNLLNNEAAHSKHNANRFQLQHKLRRFETIKVDGKEVSVAKEFLKPWDTFANDIFKALQGIIVSFKQNLRVINRTENWYQHFDNGKKGFVRQEGKNWAIRKSMHKDTVYGEVNLKLIKDVSLQNAIKVPDMIVDKELKQKVKELLALGNEFKQIKKYFDSEKDVWSEVKSNKIKVYYYTKDDLNDNGVPRTRYFATRKPIDTTFNAKKIVECVTDTAIQKILLAHLKSKGDNPELAFSPDGIDEMNNNIKELNGKQPHQPIYKVRCYESGEKYQIGQKGNRKTKFVEADKGTNLFFAVFETKVNEESKRTFLSIPLNVMIDCQKQFANDWRSNIENYLKEKNLVPVNSCLLFILSPNDLVYLPLKGSSDFDKSRIYKFVSCSGYQCFFVREDVAKSIVDKLEFSKLNKTERALSGEMIKEICVPLKVDRLGNIIKVGI